MVDFKIRMPSLEDVAEGLAVLDGEEFCWWFDGFEDDFGKGTGAGSELDDVAGIFKIDRSADSLR